VICRGEAVSQAAKHIILFVLRIRRFVRLRLVLRGRMWWRLWRVRQLMTDRVGLTWHPRLAAAILAARERIDVVEVIPEGTFLESRATQRALRRLAREIPVAIHGVSLGLASTTAVDERRVGQFARLIDYVQPDCWSEHLAFVRAGGIELGHLAAPSRTETTIDATAVNIHRAASAIGAYPLVENVATIIDPPGSELDEQNVADTPARYHPGGSALRSAQSLRERNKLWLQRGGRPALDTAAPHPVHPSRGRRTRSGLDRPAAVARRPSARRAGPRL
jgi:hypothetical protein